MSKLFTVTKLRDGAVAPSRATTDAFCYDLRACLDGVETVPVYFDDETKVDVQVKNLPEFDNQNGFWLEPRGRACIPTGLRFNVSKGYGVLIFPRSGLSLKKGLSLSNSVGVIDSDYTHEVGITLWNTTNQRQFIRTGERLCQCALMKVEFPDTTLTILEDGDQVSVEKPSKKKSPNVSGDKGEQVATTRTGGFGSTGQK